MIDISKINYQADILSTLILYPKLYRYCILKHEYFTWKYNTIFKAISNSIEKHNDVLNTEIIKYKGIDIDLYFGLADMAYSNDVDRFNEMQKIVIREYKERMAIEMSNKLAKKEITFEEFLNDIEEVNKLKNIQSHLLTLDKLRNSITSNKNSIKFHRFKQLENKLNLKENDFMVIAGGTSVGKTGVTLNLLDDLSISYPCIYMNMEMVEDELYQRLISINSGYELNIISSYKNMVNEDANKIGETINRLAAKKINVHNGSSSITTIKNTIASFESEKHFIVFIDHFGLITSKERNSYERATENAKALRALALDYNCTIVALSQLNREALKQAKPSLSMLRDSGELEQSASKVVFVWNDGKNGTDDYSLVIEKNRSGKKGYIPINYNKKTQEVFEVKHV